MKYRPEIDGLRTVAVIPVIIFHLGYPFMKGGYYGVDVFFVISGYLITGILAQSIKEEKFSMFSFWMRRVKRLLPALLVTVLVTLILAPLLIFKPVIREIVSDVFPAIFSYFNFHALYDFGNYWGGKSSNSFFLHVWSLSVEEQFYLVYPFLLFLFYRFFKGFVQFILVLTVLSFVFFTLYLKINQEFTFYMLPTRVWELSIGGLIAVANLKQHSGIIFRKPVQEGLAALGISLVILSYFVGGATISNMAIFPVLGSAMLIAFCSSVGFVGRFLSSKLVVFIGKLSYSMYLWHWPIIILFRNLSYQLHNINIHLLSVFIFLLTALLSYATYILVENKTRNYKHTPKIVLAGIAVISVLVLSYSNVFGIYYKSEYNKLTNYIYYYDISPKQAEIEENNPLDYEVNIPMRPKEYNDAYKKEGIIRRVGSKDPELMVLGDSHGVMWAKLIDEVSDEMELSRAFFTSNGSTAFFDAKHVELQKETKLYTVSQRIEYAKAVTSNLDKWKPRIFVIACRWDELKDLNKQYLNDLLTVLENRHTNVLLLTQPPKLSFMTNKNPNQYFTYLGIDPVDGYNEIDVFNNNDVISANNYLKTLTKKFNNVFIYDVFGNMTGNGKMKISMNRDVFYFDDDHLSYMGTAFHKEKIKTALKEILTQENNS